MTQAPTTTNYTSSKPREISRIGSVTVILDNNEPIEAASFTLSSQRCCWFDLDGILVLEQGFSQPPPIPWRHATMHRPQTVSFIVRDMQISEFLIHGRPAKNPIDGVQYVFRDNDLYKEFQSQLRDKSFLAEYETKRVDVSNAEYTEDQCIKLWEHVSHDGGKTVTLPVTFPNRQVRHRELPLSWLSCEKAASAKTVKLQFQSSKRKPSRSDTQISGGPPRRPSVIQNITTRLKHSPTWSSTSTSTEDSPEESARRELGNITIKFASSCDDFLRNFAHSSQSAFHPFASPRAGKLPESPELLPREGYSLYTPASLLTSSSGSTAPSIGAGSWTTRQTVSSPPSSEVPSTYATAPPIERVQAQPSAVRLPEPLVHEYWRQGGPRPADANVDLRRSRQLSESRFYEPLRGEEDFRVLRLLGGTSNRIKCRLEHHNLREAPAYEALSYCWGESTTLNRITIGRDHEFTLTSHLWDALRRLRLPNRDRLIWIDAICINQSNVSEKNRQILLMRRIYQKAHRTVVWIGNLDSVDPTCQRLYKPDEESEEALPTLCTRQGLPAFEHEDVSYELGKILQKLHDDIETNDRGDVWWKRLWCVQEFHFSVRPPSVYIGPHAISWRHFSSLFRKDSGPLDLFHDLRTPSDHSLFDLLSMTSRSRCGDPRDRIYSLLGMATAAAKAIRPDYHKSVVRVVEEACVHLITASGTVDVLVDGRVDRKYWGRERLYAVMPTWIPELTSLPKLSSVKSLNEYDAGPGRADAGLRDSEPAGDATEPIDADYDMPRALSIQAVYFDQIVARTTEADITSHEHSRSSGPECLIYNSLFERGHLLDRILKVLDYEYDAPKGARRDRSPCIGFLLLDYLFEGKRSVIEEFKRRADGPERNVPEAYRRQRRDDLHYAQQKGTQQDVDYVNQRWRRKINTAEREFVYEPQRLIKALATERDKIRQDFHVAREFENVFAYARKTDKRYYFTGTNFDAPMRADVLQCRTVADVRRLDTQYDATEHPEFHEYNEKSRKRDFFRTESGFLGMGPASLQVGDIVVMPFGASRPFILRKCNGPGDTYHQVVGEAVLPLFMSGGWVEQQKKSAREYLLK